MRRFSSVDTVTLAIFAALGLAGCGGEVDRAVQDDMGGEGTGASKDGGAEASELSADSPTAPSHPCVNPTPVILGDADTGFDTCGGSMVYPAGATAGVRRRAAVACPAFLPRPSNGACEPPEGSPSGAGNAFPASEACQSDSDCSATPHAHCEEWSPDGGVPSNGCRCIPGCLQDSDCAAAEVCLCGTPVGTCVPASCASGASCAPGYDCVTSVPGADCAPRFDCQTPSDECFPSDPSTVGVQGACSADSICTEQNGTFSCAPGQSCGVGRPFLIGGAARLAPSASRGDWSKRSASPDAGRLSPAIRARLAAQWTRVGLMEHASIAAFARFALHLLAVGAPADLVAGAHEALGDETEHARLAFGLASAYAGESVGPGRLAIDGSLDGFSIATFVATLIREGCIGETVAAIEAREALESTSDVAVREVLAIIARDELRHSELAWRTLAWLLGSRQVEPAWVRGEVARALAEITSAPRPSASDEDLRSFGIVTDLDRDELRRAAVSRGVGPSFEALMA
jgi:hypothetical protein